MALSDTFVGSGTLEAHASDSGHSWDQLAHGGSARTLTLSGGGACYLDAAFTVSGYALASWVPASADYDVTATVTATVDAGWGAVLGRAIGTNQDTDLDGYMLLLNSTNELVLYRFDNGALTSLGTYSTPVAVGNSYDVVLRFSGTTIKGFLDGVERISVTDATYSAAGSAGVGLSSTGGAGANTIVVTAVGADAPAASYTLTGPGGGPVGSASASFTVEAGGSLATTGDVVVTPSDGGGGGTFTPASVTLTDAARSATFTYTPAAAGDVVISATDDGGLTDPAPLSFAAFVGADRSFAAVFAGGPAAAVGYRVSYADGTVLYPRTTAGIAEDSDGELFQAAITLPADFVGRVVWDDTARRRYALVDYS